MDNADQRSIPAPSHSKWQQQQQQQQSPSTYYSFPLIDTPIHEEHPSSPQPPLRRLQNVHGQWARNSTTSRPRLQDTQRGRSASLQGQPSRAPVPQPQPVLAIPYTHDAQQASTNHPTSWQKWQRLLFSFNGNGKQQRQPRATTPWEENFSIENILQAIEPNIRSTLDSIAEIYGRSKLSLANEHGSHLPPLGEIRAPPLVTVEEASPPDNEGAGESAMTVSQQFSEQDPDAIRKQSMSSSPNNPSAGRASLGAIAADRTEAAPDVVSEAHLDACQDLPRSRVGKMRIVLLLLWQIFLALLPARIEDSTHGDTIEMQA